MNVPSDASCFTVSSQSLPLYLRNKYCYHVVTMIESSQFSLSKWYLDCTADNGDVLVGYAASLHWRMLSLEYSSILVRRSTGEIRTKATLQQGRLPVMMNDSVQWKCPALGLKATWIAREPPISRKVFEASATPLLWSCVQPRACADITVDGVGTFRGLGYVDHLDLSTKPWRLPLEELRWGRYLSEDDSIIWMDFKGSAPETIVFHNGLLCKGAQVSDQNIVLGEEGITLGFEDTCVLREGALVSTALSVIPGVSKFLPARMLQTYECKWKSRGVLRNAKSTLGTGWTIHEVVRWPSSK